MRSRFVKHIAVMIVLAAVLSSVIVGPAATATPTTSTVMTAELTREVVNQESDKYARAVTELSSISAIVFKSDADFKRADSIINTHARNLRLVRHRMIQIALANDTFVRAIGGEFEKAKTNEEVLKKFRANPRLLTSLSGASQAQLSIEAMLKRDYQSIKNAGEHLKSAAAAALKKKAAHPTSKLGTAMDSNTSSLAADDYIETLLAATNIIAGVVRRPLREPARPETGSGGRGSGSGGSSDSSSYQQDQKEYQNCLKTADDNHSACKQNCGIFQWVCIAHCDAFYLLATAECAFSFNNPF